MVRWVDLVGLVGFAMVVLSTMYLFPDSEEGMNWTPLLGGITLWIAGFASVVGWIWSRWSLRPPASEEKYLQQNRGVSRAKKSA